MSTYYHLAFSGGFGQLVAEGSKILTHSNPEKFPNGWRSLNPFEEIAEGALSATAGAICMHLVYKILVNKGVMEHHPTTEKIFLYTGGFLGYTSMVFLGAYLHEINNVPDVKWGPFK